jgi:copper chaperone CopZ
MTENRGPDTKNATVRGSDVADDQFVVIRVEGMHCHRCEQKIKDALTPLPGVHEVEIDFASGQASVLFSRGAVTVAELLQSVTEVGYRATGFTQSRADQSQST